MLKVKKLNVSVGEVNTITTYEIEKTPAIKTEEELLAHNEIQALLGDGYCRNAIEHVNHWIIEIASPSSANIFM
ncbi:MAG TPA: hypothetical protein VK658_16615 [Chryseolinea sp.]|nr:hypothetical protein [Chryseolinea sp.]